MNRIHKLKNDNEEWVDWQNSLQSLIQNYYHELFSSAQTDIEEVIHCMTCRITHDQNRELLKEVTQEEVKATIFHMYPDKAPGPDGIPPTFFQKH